MSITMAGKRTKWTDEVVGHIQKLKERGLTCAQIAERTGRKEKAVQQVLSFIKLSPEEREARRQRQRDYWRTQKFERRLPAKYLETDGRPTPEMIADRDRRHALPPRDLTAAFFNDPPIGRSALEMRT